MFYVNDYEPMHIHVVKGDAKAKFTISPVKLVENYGLKHHLNNSDIENGYWLSLLSRITLYV